MEAKQLVRIHEETQLVKYYDGNEVKKQADPNEIIIDSSKLTPLLPKPFARFALPKYEYSQYDAVEYSYIKNVLKKNHLLSTVVTAYNFHLGLHLKPDDLLLAIDDIATNYINQNAEELKHLFVKHQDKKKIDIAIELTDDGIPWNNVIDQWNKLIDDDAVNVDFNNAARCDFSTSTLIDKVTSNAFILDFYKEYFTYYCHLLCGIPKVNLHGDLTDWIRLLDKTTKLSNHLGGAWKKKSFLF